MNKKDKQLFYQMMRLLRYPFMQKTPRVKKIIQERIIALTKKYER